MSWTFVVGYCLLILVIGLLEWRCSGLEIQIGELQARLWEATSFPSVPTTDCKPKENENGDL